MTRFPVVVLISGRGSNLASLLGSQSSEGYQIAGVISNRPEAPGLALARSAEVPTATVDHRSFAQRSDFDARLAALIESFSPSLVVLAGFMRILGADFVDRFQGRLINIHPSLLPDFPGTNTHERALAAGVQWHGASVHFVSAEVDGGPVIAQVRLRTEPGEDAQALAGRLLPLEHLLLPRVVGLIAQGRLRYAENSVVLDEQVLPDPRLLDVDSGDWRSRPGDTKLR